MQVHTGHLNTRTVGVHELLDLSLNVPHDLGTPFGKNEIDLALPDHTALGTLGHLLQGRCRLENVEQKVLCTLDLVLDR